MVIAALAGGGTVVAAPDGEKIDQTIERALDEVYQRDLPGWDNPGEWEWVDAGGRGGGRRVRVRRVDPNAGGSGGGGGGVGSGGSAGRGSGGGRIPPPNVGSGGGSGGSPDFGSGGSGDAGFNDDGTPRSRNGTPGDPRARRRARNASSSGSGGDGGSAFGGIAQILLWGLIIVIVVLFIVYVVRQTSGMTGAEEPVKETDEAGEDPSRLLAVIERPRDDADQLAHEGRFADAIHILLLRTLHELASQNLVRVTTSMTSREVLARVPLIGDARTALAGLVTAVELTWFGDDVPGANDYARCREQFEVFAAAYRRGAAAGTAMPAGARA